MIGPSEMPIDTFSQHGNKSKAGQARTNRNANMKSVANLLRAHPFNRKMAIMIAAGNSQVIDVKNEPNRICGQCWAAAPGLK
jgi:hypothetical protein